MKKSTMAILSVVVVVVLLIIGVIGWGVSANNKFVVLDESISAAESTIQTQLQRRADLIPNLVNTVEGYAQHEEDIYTALADARAKLAGATDTAAKLEADGELSAALSRLMVVVENYPDLKASENFKDLQTQLEGTENRITRARQEYNEAVKEYNAAIRRFPGSVVASLFGYDKKAYFQASEGSQSNPQVNFD